MPLRCADITLPLDVPVVMGIINVTPDSFFDGGEFAQHSDALAHGIRLAEEGATILDVGGESTRPGAQAVPLKEELDRVIPVIEGLHAHAPHLVISVDTSKPEVMRAAAQAGARMINDVRALREPGALAAAAATDCAVCLMHMQGEPRTMQHDPQYQDVVSEVASFLRERVHSCRSAGIAAQRIALDPGFGFGKSVAHNLQLLRNLHVLGQLGQPLAVGLSRKSMLKSLLGRAPAQRLHGSVALALLAVLSGARIVRVHDVAATIDAIRIACAVRVDLAAARS